MRKFAVTTFAVLYGLLILSASAERANEWAARAAPLLAHTAGQHHVPSVVEKSEAHLWQTKILEPGFVVESPREGVALPTHAEHHTPLSLFEFHSAWTGTPVSPRAPPLQM
jgi:hypothetical protein